MPTTQFGVTVQDIPDAESAGVVQAVSQQLSQVLISRFSAARNECPPYWSMMRDDWMVEFVKRAGNDLLAGAFATLVAKVVSAGWYVEGPLLLATFARSMLLHQMDFGRGWDVGVGKWVQGFLNRDAGGDLEALRVSATDREGPAMGFAHLDESKCIPTKNPEYPITYLSERGPIKMHRSQVMRIIDTSEPRDRYQGVGFCSVSRAVTTALILLDIVKYKRERLSDLPPAGILMINNLTATQWKDLQANYDTRQHNQGNITWRDVMVILGVDPAYPITAELFELSRLPEHYDDKAATEVAIYTFALAFRVDAREYWPVSAGPLGTATEAEIQHKKAKAKGEGIIFSAIERQLNSPFGLPQSVTFHFDYRDDEEDMMAAEIAGRKITNIRRMWEPAVGAPELGGMITTEQAQALLIMDKLVSPELLGQTINIDRLYDTRALKMLGPWARVYRNGTCLILKAA